MKADQDNLKRRAPGSALGLATTRFGDWARSFLGCDRTRQLVPSFRGRARIAGRATVKSVDRAKKTFCKLGKPERKTKTAFNKI
jgi:hypothetical protein